MSGVHETSQETDEMSSEKWARANLHGLHKSRRVWILKRFN